MTGYRVQLPPTTALHRQEIELRVRQLRDYHRALGVQEVWFETLDDVLAYLNDVCGVRTKNNGRINRHMLSRWAKYRGFPLLRAHPGVVTIASSNVLIMAWMWSYRVHLETRRTKTPVAQEAYATTL